jgi:hypothetical protein
MSMNQCPEHDATDRWSSFLWHGEHFISSIALLLPIHVHS